MWHLRKNRCLATLAAGVFVTLLWAGNLWSAPDPVEELRQSLSIPPSDRRNPTDAVLSFRRAALEKNVAALRTISDLRRALTLVEWKEDLDLVSKVQDLDEEMRKQIGTRLQKELQNVARRGTANSRLAVANLIAEMGPSVRALDLADTGGFARSLAPIVVELARDKDLAVRQQALRALGSINADPKIAVPVFVEALKTDPGTGSRRLAAGGLVQLVKVVTHLQKREQTKSTGVMAKPTDLVDTARDVVKASAAGMNDADAEVRALCLEAIETAAAAFADFPGALDRKAEQFPPKGRPLTEAEVNAIKLKFYDPVQSRIQEIKTLLKAMADHGKNLDRALEDPHERVRRAAVSALEHMGHLRLRMKQRVDSLPPLPKVPLPKIDEDFDNMIVGRRAGVARLLADKSTELRRGAIEFLEDLDQDAVPVIPALIERLCDSDRFIRWTAARTLGNLPPAKSAVAVPGLIALLQDIDLDVRLAVANALEKLGPYAKEAVPALDRTILHGDAEFRIAVMYVLESIGPEHSQPAIANLAKSLVYELAPDARVRRVAAEVLGKFGPLARPAVPALRQALGDDDAEVRTRASDALLNILVSPKD